MDTVIDIRGLTKRFRGKTAVDGLILAVPAGSIFALLGDNGAARPRPSVCSPGQLPPDDGQATILGQDCWKAAAKLRSKGRLCAGTAQVLRLDDGARDRLVLRWLPSAGYLARYQKLAGRYRLDPRAKLKNLSKGEYSKVALSNRPGHGSRSVDPDEPTSGLDLLVRREFLSSMVDLGRWRPNHPHFQSSDRRGRARGQPRRFHLPG